MLRADEEFASRRRQQFEIRAERKDGTTRRDFSLLLHSEHEGLSFCF